MIQLDAFRVELRGTHLVEASAGTGKTHAITTLYLRAVVERGLLPSQLLVVTFTRAATSEIKNRIRDRLRQAILVLLGSIETADRALQSYLEQLPNRTRAIERLRRALQNIDDAAIFTIHGFCQRALEQHAFESRTRFGQTLLESLDDLHSEALNDSLIAELSRCHPVVLRRFLSNGGQARAMQLMRAIATRPSLRTVPELVQSEGLEESVEAFRQAQTRARQRFDLDEVYRILSRHSGLNRQKVRVETLYEKLATHALILQPFAEVEPWPKDCLLQQATLDKCVNKGKSAPQHPLFQACDDLFTAYEHLNERLTSEQYRVELACVSTAMAKEAKRKAAQAVQGFDDLLLDLRDALDTEGAEPLTIALRERFPVAMIDEFQDTDPIQYSIFTKIYSTKAATLFLIGDPKQSIYAFRGADLHAYIAASTSDQLHRHSLEVNWRSDKRLIEAINTLYTRRDNPFLLPEIQYRPMLARPNAKDALDDSGKAISGVTISLVPTDTSTSVSGRKATERAKVTRLRCATEAALQVKRWLLRKMDGKHILPKDIAVLTRTNEEALSMQEALRQFEIVSSLTTDTSVLATPEAVQFITIVRALTNPNDSHLVTAAILSPGFGISPCELVKRLDDAASWDRDSENFVRGHELLLRNGVYAATQYIFDTYDFVTRLLRGPDGERRVTNLYHMMEIAELQQSKRDLLPSALLRLLLRLRQDPTEIAAEARQLRIESDEHAVKITTIHRSKGLEYPIVVCPFLWSDSPRSLTKNDILVYHDAGLNNWVADLRGKLAPAQSRDAAERERQGEVHRLIYVALTRARHAVTLLLPQSKGREASALGQILGAFCADSPPDSDSACDPEGACPSIRVESERVDSDAPLALETAEVACLDYKPLTRRICQAWTSSSFTALVAGRPGHTLNHFEEQGKDVDAHSTSDVSDSEVSTSARFQSLRPGAESGDILHKILESVDFVSFDPSTDIIVDPLLARLGSEAQSDGLRIKQDLAAVLEAPLLACVPGFNLRRIDLRHRRSELQFSMGIGWSKGAKLLERVSPRRLAAALTPEATGLDASYGTSIERLGFESLAGYLRGFIDLVFEYEGRTYVVDYKSTSISSTIAGFTPERISQTVAASHYALQTALYSLVLHRHLRWRKAGYDYDRDFGGTLVVFLRGVCPAEQPGHSVFFHRATRSAIDALDAVFEPGETS